MKLGEVFGDHEVAALYRHRPPYPQGIIDILARLLVEPRTVLDAGAGTGALARELVPFAERVDALDPSASMIAAGRLLRNGNDPRIRWTLGRAEDASVDPPYGLITCGASLHWMDHAVVLPRFRTMLAPGAKLAIADIENVHPSTGVRDAVLSLIVRYSPIEHHVSTREMIDDLVARGLLIIEGSEATAPLAFEQSVEEYVGLLGSTASLNRTTLGARAGDLEREVRAAFASYGIERVRYDVVGTVAWGRPA